jgi:hypothetical protein
MHSVIAIGYCHVLRRRFARFRCSETILVYWWYVSLVPRFAAIILLRPYAGIRQYDEWIGRGQVPEGERREYGTSIGAKVHFL